MSDRPLRNAARGKAQHNLWHGLTQDDVRTLSGPEAYIAGFQDGGVWASHRALVVSPEQLQQLLILHLSDLADEEVLNEKVDYIFADIQSTQKEENS